jgi:glycosyltransferase involved in cell wall biosynthesis
MKLALFFTHGMSLEKWAKIGSLSREIKPYQMILSKFEQVYFFTYGSKNDLNFAKELGSSITVLPKKANIPNCLYGFLMPFFYRKILKDVDVLKTNQMAGATPAIIAKLIFRKKLVVRNGYEWFNVLVKENKIFWKKAVVYILESLVYKIANAVVFTSLKDKNFAKEKFNIPEKKIYLIPNYIDSSLFSPQSITKEKGKIIFVGRLSKEKNLFNLIEAMVGLEATLTLIGQGYLRDNLEQFAKIKKVQVEFLGKIPNEDLPSELSKAEIFALLSFYEGNPKALLEAMSCSLACLASNVEGINEVIIHKENGYLCQTDTVSIRKALIELLGDGDLRDKIGSNARQTILQGFTLEKIIEKEYELLENFS